MYYFTPGGDSPPKIKHKSINPAFLSIKHKVTPAKTVADSIFCTIKHKVTPAQLNTSFNLALDAQFK